MLPIDLKDYPNYSLLFLRVKNPHFDVTQSIYPLLTSPGASESNPPKDLGEIVGYSLRELLNNREEVFLNGRVNYLVRLVDENMQMKKQALIQVGSTNYSSAEASLKGEPLPVLPSTVPPPQSERASFLPRPREMRGNLLLGFATFLFLTFIALAYFNREAFRTWGP